MHGSEPGRREQLPGRISLNQRVMVSDHRNRRGGLGRPVGVSSVPRRVAGFVVATTAWLMVLASQASAHGGIPSLQLTADRINPGGSVELRGDMTGDEPVDLSLQAGDGSTLALGRIETDWEGHFVTAVSIPADVAAGTYIVRVTSPFEEATTRLVVAGPPLLPGAEGQPLGRDEALAERGSVAAAPAGQTATQWTPPPGADSTVRVIGAVIVVALVLVFALAVGTVSRRRTRRT